MLPLLNRWLRTGLFLLLATTAAAERDAASFVDPFIGTGGHGHTFPGATLPFGMVQLSPDTRLEGWDGCSGYHHDDRVVYGFSHTHLSGTGVSDYGDILFMPVVGEAPFDNGYETSPDEGYASRFSKASESAEPGYYAVRLGDSGIDVELTATERTGLHRYRFPETGPAFVILDLAHRDEVIESSLRVVNAREIEGYRRSTGWAKDQVVHFVARFSQPILRAELARDDAVVPGADLLKGKNLKARLFMGEPGRELLIRVGLSSVDANGARLNLNREQGTRSFEAVRGGARRSWNAALGRLDIEGGTTAQRTIFYTALYHAMIAPNVWSDVDGGYRGMDGRVHRAVGRRQYTVFSLWDTFRSTHPLFNLIEPVRTREFIDTFLAMYEQGGRLPVWELAANETDTMIGYHSVPVIVDAWVKGIRGFDEGLALEAMVHSATREHHGLESYQRQGFVASEDDAESVSKTLEYAFDDWCISRFAAELGQAGTAERFEQRSQGWRHLLDPDTGFMRARRNQRWVTPFDPYQVDQHYTEANSWQYSFFVPQDLDGLSSVFGGDEGFVERLDSLFEADTATTGRDQADITGLIGQYAHGNEPSHHVAWLYHHAGQPGRSAERVDQIQTELYSDQPDGLSGNEDCGQMSSWHVFAAIGLYPVTPCSDEYLIGVPSFERVALTLAGGTFTIRTRGLKPGAGARVEHAWLNGLPLSRSFLRHDEVAAGGELVLGLASQASRSWGVAQENRPNSRLIGERIPAAPYLRADSEKFRDDLRVELASADAGATIQYAVLPDETWRVYDEPFVIAESTTLRFVAEREGRRSPIVESYLHRIPNDWTVPECSETAPQYSADGPLSLVDGLRANTNWRIGGWLGVQGKDFSATVDLGESRSLSRVRASFLQDQRAWIWMPTEILVSVSDDGKTYRDIARIRTTEALDTPDALLSDAVAELEQPEEARYVRVLARNLGTIPAWHLGAGGDPWIFIDEIEVE